MKGIIAISLKGMVIEKYNEEKWEQILERTGLDKKTIFYMSQDIEDSIIFKCIQNTCAELNWTESKFNQEFGKYWVEKYIPNSSYKIISNNMKSAKEYILKMDSIHDMVTRNVPNATPPRFKYEWVNKQTLKMYYDSKRGLIDLLVGLAEGVLSYCKEAGHVKKISQTCIEIRFEDSKSFNDNF